MSPRMAHVAKVVALTLAGMVLAVALAILT
jgi:hypothetical protein